MAKYGKKIVKQITDLIKSDTYTIAEICRQCGIDSSTFHLWVNSKPEFAEAVEKARDERMKLFSQEAEKSLMKKIRGYTVQEKHTVTVESGKKDEKGNPIPKIKEQRIVDKHFQADTAAIIFTLTNTQPDKWKNKQFAEVTGKDGKDLVPARVLTKKEAVELLKELENEC